MADTKISALTELAAEPAADDEFLVVDKSDTTMAASGTDKRMRYDRISGLWIPASYLDTAQALGTSDTKVSTQKATKAYIDAGDWVRPADHAMVAWNYDPLLSRTGLSHTTGILYLQRVRVPACTISTLWYVIRTQGTSLTNVFGGIYGPTGTLLGQGSTWLTEAGAATNWNSTGIKKATMTAESGQSLTVAAGFIYVGALQVGTTAAQPQCFDPPAAGQYNIGLSNSGAIATSYRWGVYSSGLSSLPSLTLSSIATTDRVDWVALSGSLT